MRLMVPCPWRGMILVGLFCMVGSHPVAVAQGGSSGPLLDAAERAAVIATMINPDPSVYPTVHCRLYRRDVVFITGEFPEVPGSRFDGCMYEPSDGFLFTEFEGLSLPGDNQLVLRHRLRDDPEYLHVTKITAEPGAIEVEAHLEPDPAIESISSPMPTTAATPNLCWGFQKAPNFVAGGVVEPPYGESPELYPEWVGRCFVYTAEGRTFLGETVRRQTNEVPLDDPRNNPVWPQHYVGVWQRVKGGPFPPNTSLTRYTIPLIGAVSNDNDYLIALACDSTRYVAQAWHTCLHHVPAWRENASGGGRGWRQKVYAMRNDPDALLARVEEDFPAAVALKNNPVPAE